MFSTLKQVFPHFPQPQGCFKIIVAVSHWPFLSLSLSPRSLYLNIYLKWTARQNFIHFRYINNMVWIKSQWTPVINVIHAHICIPPNRFAIVNIIHKFPLHFRFISIEINCSSCGCTWAGFAFVESFRKAFQMIFSFIENRIHQKFTFISFDSLYELHSMKKPPPTYTNAHTHKSHWEKPKSQI